MSPLFRSRARSFSRLRRFPRRTFRTQWIGFAAGTGPVAPDNTQIATILTSGQTTTNYGLNNATVIRVRGELVATFNGAETGFRHALLWIGVAVFDLDDTLAGGNPDNPFDDADSNQWMLHRSVYLWNGISETTNVVTDARGATTAAVRYDIDVRSRRVIGTDRALALVVSNPQLNPPAATAGVALTGRLLLHEFGR